MQDSFELVLWLRGKQSLVIDVKIEEQVDQEYERDKFIGKIPFTDCCTCCFGIILNDLVAAHAESKHEADHEDVEHLIRSVVDAAFYFASIRLLIIVHNTRFIKRPRKHLIYASPLSHPLL